MRKIIMKAKNAMWCKVVWWKVVWMIRFRLIFAQIRLNLIKDPNLDQLIMAAKAWGDGL